MRVCQFHHPSRRENGKYYIKSSVGAQGAFPKKFMPGRICVIHRTSFPFKLRRFSKRLRGWCVRRRCERQSSQIKRVVLQSRPAEVDEQGIRNARGAEIVQDLRPFDLRYGLYGLKLHDELAVKAGEVGPPDRWQRFSVIMAYALGLSRRIMPRMIPHSRHRRRR